MPLPERSDFFRSCCRVGQCEAMTHNRNTSERENIMLRNCVLTLFVLSLFVMVHAATARAVDTAASSYPDWAASVVPLYPHVLPSSGLLTPKSYGIATTDDFPTVVAWYKARVHDAWSETEGGNTWQVVSRGLRIQ